MAAMQISSDMANATTNCAMSVISHNNERHSDIRIFNNPQFGEIRIALDSNNEPLFCAADLCKALGYSNGRDAISKHVDEGDVAKRDTPTTSGVQSMTYVNESGMYALIFGSKLDGARIFKRWVTSDVLPTIRKTGEYHAQPLTPAQQLLANAQMLVEMEQRQMEQARRQDLIEHKVERIEARIRANGFMSVMGFANIHHLNIGKKAAQAIGRLASKWCKRNGRIPEKTKHERWGEVNTYPMEALKCCFAEFYPDKRGEFAKQLSYSER